MRKDATGGTGALWSSFHWWLDSAACPAHVQRMGKPLQFLVAVTCIAVLAAIGFAWANHRSELVAERDAAARRADAVRYVLDQQERQECTRVMKAWNIGGAALIREKGVEQAHQRVKDCTAMLAP